MQSCRIPYHTIPYHTIPYHTVPYRTIPCHAMPCHAIPYHTIPYHTIPCHAMPCHAMPCRAIPYHTIPYHAMPCHTMPCHIVSLLSYHRVTRTLKTIVHLNLVLALGLADLVFLFGNLAENNKVSASVITGRNLNFANFTYIGSLHQFGTILPRGSVRIISYGSSVNTGANLNQTNLIYTG